MGGTFRIRTCHGTYLLVGPHRGRVHHGKLGLNRSNLLFAYQPKGNTQNLFLAAEIAGPFEPELLPQEQVSRFVPVAMTRPASDGSVSFFSTWTGRFLLAIPFGPDKASEIVLFDAQEPNDYEKFFLEPVEKDEVPGHLKDAMPVLDLAAGGSVTAQSLAGAIFNAPAQDLTRDVLNAAGFLLSRRECERLAENLIMRSELGVRIAALYPDDLAARYALIPAISKVRMQRGLQFRSEGSISSQSEIGSEFDQLDHVGISGKFISFPAAATMLVRGHSRPQKRAAILATARNEGLYILEWIAYHKALGFEDFVIYSNDNDDGSDCLLEALATLGEIRWIRNRSGLGVRPQWKAYNHALRADVALLDCEWVLVIDLDERLELDQSYFSTIAEYLDWAETTPVDAIGFNWLMIGPNGETHWREGLLRERFAIAGPRGGFASQFIKSMFRPTRFAAAMPHHPVEGRSENLALRGPTMKPFKSNPSAGSGESIEPNIRFGWIAHYFFKSNEEFALKFSRPRGDDQVGEAARFSALTPDFIRGFVEASLSAPASHTPDLLDERTKANLSEFLAHPKIRKAMDEIKAFYANRLQQILPDLISCSGIKESGEYGQIFLRPLLQGHTRLTPSRSE